MLGKTDFGRGNARDFFLVGSDGFRGLMALCDRPSRKRLALADSTSSDAPVRPPKNKRVCHPKFPNVDTREISS